MGARCSFRKLKTMKKNIFFLLLFIFTISFNYAQERFATKSGVVNFEASVPSFEEVKATHNSVSAILKSNGDFASLALVRGFRFKVALMEEHFNESYLNLVSIQRLHLVEKSRILIVPNCRVFKRIMYY